MIGCLRTRVRKQPIIALYFEFENELKLKRAHHKAVYLTLFVWLGVVDDIHCIIRMFAGITSFFSQSKLYCS